MRVQAEGGATRARYEPVIGLEIHVQLRTKTKMFCGNAAVYGAAPNSHLCPVCMGLPGSLPVLNAHAVRLGVRAALGLRCTVHPHSLFVRKSYFYPDLPKGYQITQQERPLASGGWMEVPAAKGGAARRVRIRRVHLEEDTGRSLHDRVPGATAIDLNRAGVPLIEIVTEPDLRSPGEARALLGRLKQALEYLDVSDCNLEEGSLRVDANVSLRGPGGGAGTPTEVKNLNSFANVERALRAEIARQAEVLAGGGRVERMTLRWDAARGEARPLRAGGEIEDYRYLPEPDLPPLVLPGEWIEQERAALAEMPWERVERLARQHGLPPGQAEVICSERELADYYEALVAAGAEAREAAGWVQGEVLALLNARGMAIGSLRIEPVALAELLGMLRSGAVSRAAAREAFARMADTGGSAARVVAEHGLEMETDAGRLAGWVEAVMDANPEEVRRFRAGEDRLLAYFVGQVMRLAGGRADAREVGALLRRRLGR